MSAYTKLPSKAKVKPTPFEANVSEDKLKQMLELVRLSPIGPATYENQDKSRKWGMTREWLADAKEQWATKFDWRATEKRINSFPNYTMPIKDDDGSKYTMHFIALFSDNENAIPIAFFHGWPGSILEFLEMLDLIKAKYTPDKLPYHIIVPSLPGYTFSTGPPTTVNATIHTMSRVCQKLMHQLGFGDGYIAQGGDLGSHTSRLCAGMDDACKAYHLNMLMLEPPKNAASLPLDDLEKKVFPNGKKWIDYGSSYGQEHGTRGGTIGLALSASPIAMLAWIGEKFLEWTDEDPTVTQVLESVSLYWLTECYPKGLYAYRCFYSDVGEEWTKEFKQSMSKTKPMGYSWFPYDLVPTPLSWIATAGNLVWSKRHSSGGHFAAMEKPKVLLEDVEEFVKVAWKSESKL